MTATGTDFSNPEGMYLDAVVVVDDDDVVLASTFFLCFDFGSWVFSFGLLFRPVRRFLYPKKFFYSFFFFGCVYQLF